MLLRAAARAAPRRPLVRTFATEKEIAMRIAATKASRRARGPSPTRALNRGDGAAPPPRARPARPASPPATAAN